MNSKGNPKRKLLISAYACDPYHGSEQGFAWSWIISCADRYEVTVITSYSQKEHIEEALKKEKNIVKFKYIKGSKRISPSGVQHRFERFKVYLWQLYAIFYIRKFLRNEKFDIAQHISVATWRLPSFLVFSNIPFVMGPLSGSEQIPPGFAKYLGLRGFLWTYFRTIMINISKIDPFVILTLKHAQMILVSGPITYEYLKSKHPGKVTYLTRTYRYTTEKLLYHIPKKLDNSKSVNIVWVGQLIPRKGLDLLLRALKDKRLYNITLHIIGDGPLKNRYMKLAKKYKIDSKINFLGNQSRKKVLNMLGTYDLFVFTSLQDMMGQALSEAMQIGLPCIVFDWSGPGKLVGDNGALKVKVSSFNETCDNLAEKLFRLCFDYELRKKYSRNAKERISSLNNPSYINSQRDKIFNSIIMNLKS